MTEERLPFTLYHFQPRGSTRPDFSYPKPKMTIIKPDDFKFTKPKPKEITSNRLTRLQKHVPEARFDQPEATQRTREPSPNDDIITSIIADEHGHTHKENITVLDDSKIIDSSNKSPSSRKTNKRRICRKKQWPGVPYLSTF